MAAELRELLRSLRLPVIAAPMLRVSELALAAAACRAGIVGAFPTVNARSSTRLDEWLDALDAVQREDGAAPYCPNLIIKAPTLYEHLAVITQHDTRLVITSVGSPAPVIEPLHAAGTFVLADVASVAHARRAADVGADGLVLLTAGAGGQTGWLNPFAFVAAVREFFDGVLIVAGGMSSGASVLAAEAAGYDAAYLGTRFIATPESAAAAEYQRMLVDSSMDDVLLTRAFTGLQTNILRPSIELAGIDPDRLDETVSPDLAGRLAARTLDAYPNRVAFRWDGGEITYAALKAAVGRYQQVLLDAGLQKGQRVAALGGNRFEVWAIGTASQSLGMYVTWLHPMGGLADQLFQIEDAEVSALVLDETYFGDRSEQLAVEGKQRGHKVWTMGPSAYADDLESLADAVGDTPMRVAGLADDRTIINYTLLNGFDPAAILQTIEREQITMALFVPTMIYALLDHPDLATRDLSSLELVLYGASPMSVSRLREGIEKIGPVFAQLYGQTECYPVSMLTKEDHDLAHPERLLSCGKPVTGVDVTIRDESNNEVPTGEAGEPCVRGSSAMDRYWKRPDLTDETLAGGWLHTGDIAKLDADGFIYIVDRKKDMIISGGFNVFPREVEDALTAHPDVASAAVYGIPHEKWGEQVTASVVLKPGGTVDSEALVEHVRALKGPVQTPKVIEILTELPQTAVGKINKRALRDRHTD